MSRLSKKQRLLVVDDDPGVVDYLVEMLTDAGFAAHGAVSAKEALDLLACQDVDLVITDVKMPEMGGLELLSAILKAKPGQLVVLMTAFGSIDLAVQAMRAGACDFVTKPFRIEALLLSVERVFRERQMRREIVRLRTKVQGAFAGELVAKSESMRKIVELARRAALTDSTVLLTGESGTGKGAIARFIHDHSQRRAGPFVQVNCAAVPESLTESELFGVHKGAFTDAKEHRNGLFNEAHEGTLFLDEITEMPPEAQAKLLQVLETGRVRPLGSTTEEQVSVRIITAANRPLEEALRERRFRPDLYYRLNVIRLDLPPLRERREDIMDFVDVFLQKASCQLGRPIIGVSTDAMKRLISYEWPGNVRELANAIERAVALAEHDTILPEDLMIPTGGSSEQDFVSRASERNVPLAELERAYIEKILEATGGNKARAARILGIDRRTLYRKAEGKAAGTSEEEEAEGEEER